MSADGSLSRPDGSLSGLGRFLLDSVLEYCRSTTVHGFAYLPSTVIFLVEKLFWALVRQLSFFSAR